MEFLGKVFEIAKNIGEGMEIAKNIGEWYGYHSRLEENMQNLKRKIEHLSAQENDINKEISNAEHREWKRRKTEVVLWLGDVQQLKDDVPRLEQDIVAGRSLLTLFSRVRLGKHIIQKIQEVEGLQEKGRAFNGLLVDEFPTGRLLMPPTRGFVESTEARNMERVWECLMNDEDRLIGVFGMGGVGKTTIMNHIRNKLLKETGKYDSVFWVTISKPFNVIKLQSDIAKELNFSLLDDEDETRRARELHEVFSRWKRYVLIIDDLWEVFQLEGVGIPEPTRSNGCKVVLTTRSFEVCRMMDCKTIKVELLTEHEALNLFRNKAFGRDTMLAPEVEEIATKIAKECARLPLAIVIVGVSMRGLKAISEWRNALNELTSLTKDANDVESTVFKQLKFSYSRLGYKVLQDCFLYCSLYPEDRAIPMEELIEYWIAEGLIANMTSLQAQFDKGHDIIRQLRSVCLVESCINQDGRECVRMHDLIRDMALRITRSSPRFMVKAGERRESIPDEDWSGDLEKISFMGSRIRELPIKPPVCPGLTTLLLNEIGLEGIPDSFFTNMPWLKVLDLSDNKIKSLPVSISNLENLHALILSRCHQLMDVPSLETLKALKVFILTSSLIEEIPEGIEELVNLTKLDLSDNFHLGMFPTCKLRRLSKLIFLRMDGTKVHVSAEDLMCLRELKVVAVHLHSIRELTRYVTSQHWQGLEKYWLRVGDKQDDELKINGKEVCISYKYSEPLVSGVRNQIVLPANIDLFQLDGFNNLTSLSAIPSLKDARDLRTCDVSFCDGFESIFSSSSFSENGQVSLRTVETFKLSMLPRFRVLFDGIAPPPNISFNLKKLFFWSCRTMKSIFPVQFLQNFPNLETLRVTYCENVEDIIVEREEMSNRDHCADNIDTINLPKLQSLDLKGLPRLKSIYNGMMVCQSIEKVIVANCPMVRRLPISLHMDSQQATTPPSLKLIQADEEWWESLEWDVPRTKTILQPFVRECREARNVERVLECLMNYEDRRIGVFGTGGVGKTTIMKHINNRLLQETGMFDAVFWVTASKPFNITNLQSKIAKELNFSLSDDKDVTRRAKQIQAMLCLQKRYVLIIDDLWEVFLLEGVGIPKPTGSNGCKLVLTTRSLEVCTGMRCKTVKVELLTEQEALTLFLNVAVGDDTVLAPEVKVIATQITKECARLPLAIVTVAGSLRGLKGTRDWRNALNELIRLMKDASDGESEVFERLKFSYSRLGNKVLQDCFLYCSLYPEDHDIPVTELIEYWIAEEFIADLTSVEAKFDKGHAILAKLTNSSLLESFVDKDGNDFIRIHDLIRDMALKITAISPRFMVKAGESIDSVGYEHWSEDLERISFMGSRIRELSIIPPVCPRLTTLLLSYISLKEIPDSFFTNMRCLEVLDLSYNIEIESLPKSISNLENLHALILDRCDILNYVPSLEKLKALKVFTLTGTKVEKLPEGIEELVNLTKLDLSDNFELGMFPSCKLRRLSKLRFLRMDGTKVSVSAEDLLCLRGLKVVAVHFHNVQELSRYATSQCCQGLENYLLFVGPKHDNEEKFYRNQVWISSQCEPLESGVFDQPLLPANIEFFHLVGFDNVINLSAISSLKDARYLRKFCVSNGNGLESIFSLSSFTEDGQIFLGTVEVLELAVLPSYRALFDGGIAPPHNISFNLKILYFWRCHIMKNIFPVQFLENFPNLETLRVSNCKNVEDIFVETEEMSDRDRRPDDIRTINLPKLQTLKLKRLPRLESIYNGMMVCQSIEKVIVANCPMVRRLPLSLHMDSQQATTPPCLMSIAGDEQWWESLEWDDPFTKTILEPFFTGGLPEEFDDDYLSEESDDDDL